MTEPFPLSPSLWAATAPPADETLPLEEAVRCDVCVIGGGFAGLSTALHLAERGASVIVLEAREPGWGASGRNGGQVIPGLKYDPDELLAKVPERGEELVDFAAGTADGVFDLIARNGMDVPSQRAGWIQGAHNPASVETVARRAEQWFRRGVAARVLDADEMEARVGTAQYLGGWHDPRGGAIQPLAFVRGLARAAMKAGVAIHGETAATRIGRTDGRFQVGTARGATVTADKVAICTNGYSDDLVPGLGRTVITPNSFQIATAPLSDNVRRSILPGGEFLSDTRQLLLYFRLDHEGRLILGGRGHFREPTKAGSWAHLERVLPKLFPQISGVPIAHRWCGRVALTRDFLPHLHEPEPGLVVDIGCMGRGIGLQTAMGARMASYLLSGDARDLPFPIVPIRPLPLHGLSRAYAGAIIAWYRLTDGGMRAPRRSA